MTGVRGRRRGVRVPTPGPYGVAVTDPATGRVRLRLTDEGQRLLAEWLTRSPDPAALLVAVFPWTVRRAVAYGMTEQELAAACLSGATAAMCRYDPSRSQFGTYCVHWMRRAVLVEDWRVCPRTRKRLLDRGRGTANDPDRGGFLARIAVRRHQHPKGLDWDAVRPAVHRLLCQRVEHYGHREYFAMRFGLLNGLPIPRRTLAAAWGWSDEQAEQVERDVFAALGADLEALADVVRGGRGTAH